MPEGFEIQAMLQRPGRTPLDLTPFLGSAVQWTTLAVGGFGACTITLPGDPKRWKREIPELSLLRLTHGTRVLWEGEVEDPGLSYTEGELAYRLTAIGLRSYLERTSVRRLWSKRDLEFTQGQLSQWTPDPAYNVQTGNFDPADLTKTGIRFMGSSEPAVTTKSNYWRIRAPSGLTFVRVMGTYQKAGSANLTAQIWSSPDFAVYTNHLNSAANTTAAFDYALVANAVDVLFGATTSVAYTPTSADFAQFYDVRALGTSLTEDVAGGFYGGTILRDLIALVPGLTLGDIESGSDFTIQAIERAVRSTALSVAEEVAGYYTREWGVWEDGRYDWKTYNLDEPQWFTTLEDLDELDLDGSVDGMAKTLYVLYSHPSEQREKEQSSTSTKQSNP